MGLFGNPVRGLRLHFEVEVEGVDHLLHGGLSYASHEGASLARLLVGDDFKAAFEGGDFLHVGLTGVFGGYVDHHDEHADEHGEPVAGEEVARQHLASEKAGDY